VSDADGRTVVAPASAQGSSAIAVIQVAGPRAQAMIVGHSGLADAPRCGEVVLTGLHDREGRPVDRVLVACLSEDQPLYEITCHGGVRVVQRIVELFQEAGAVLVDTVELLGQTYRLENPVAAEAYRLLPGALTAKAGRFLLHQAHEGFARVHERLAGASREELSACLAHWPAAKRLLSGMTVAIVGPANAGKSTLLNCLSAHERALVADLPGTTRDYVCSEVEIEGVPVRLFDTAGLGRTADPLAAEARARTIQACEQAEFVVIVLDATATAGLAEQLAECVAIAPVKRLVDDGRAVTVVNKIDSPDRWHELDELDVASPTVEISALTGLNVDGLGRALLDLAGLRELDIRQPCVFAEGQADEVRRVLDRLRDGR